VREAQGFQNAGDLANGKVRQRWAHAAPGTWK
jgi:hypothetical protein